MQIFGSDLLAKAIRQGTPEENLKDLQQLKEKLQVIKEEKIFETSGENVLGAATQENSFADYYLLESTQLDLDQALQEFSKNKTVEFAEANYIYHIMAEPNDPYFPQLWGMSKIEAPTAWDIATGSESIIVAVIDTGINYNHEDFDPGLIIKGPNYAYGGSDPMDNNGHGTHVAGTIGAIGNNSIGVVGVNWRVKIMAIKALNGGSGSLTAIASGVKYAADNGARVINMSLGGPTTNKTLGEAINYASEKGVVIIAAAGNCRPTCAVSYPARYPEVIAVAATDSSDRRAAFSSYGNTIEIAAPGVSIGSTYGSGYDSLSGTSMACPHVAGLAGLILANNPSLTADQVRQILTSTADDLGQAGRDSYYGYGRINAARALGAVNISPTPTGQTPTPSPTPGGPTLTPTPTHPPGFTPTVTPTPTATITPTAGPSPTPAPGQISSLKIEVMLQGIHSQKPDKEFIVKIKSESREAIKSQAFSSDDKGIYSSTVDLVSENLENGSFNIFLKTDYFLQKKFSGVVLGGGENTLTRVAQEDLLRVGDINNSGVVDQEDINLLAAAYSPFNFISNPADLNLNNLVNSLDYSLLTSNLNRSDDNGPTLTPTPTSTASPTPKKPTPTPTSSPTATPAFSPTPSPTETCFEVVGSLSCKLSENLENEIGSLACKDYKTGLECACITKKGVKACVISPQIGNKAICCSEYNCTPQKSKIEGTYRVESCRDAPGVCGNKSRQKAVWTLCPLP